jgi:hypothetical protein
MHNPDHPLTEEEYKKQYKLFVEDTKRLTDRLIKSSKETTINGIYEMHPDSIKAAEIEWEQLVLKYPLIKPSVKYRPHFLYGYEYYKVSDSLCWKYMPGNYGQNGVFTLTVKDDAGKYVEPFSSKLVKELVNKGAVLENNSITITGNCINITGKSRKIYGFKLDAQAKTATGAVCFIDSQNVSKVNRMKRYDHIDFNTADLRVGNYLFWINPNPVFVKQPTPAKPYQIKLKVLKPKQTDPNLFKRTLIQDITKS